ncbi:hypothetical protein OG288_15875 [Streptomyces tauricus]|uniref:Transcriptional regulator n=1 Tax=Streptomyces tauricus TaxID=68274 RepID=A0ABZ1JIR9_9ACTN|nr:hypothetical protein [Streptomyces tauricus]
MSTMIEVEITAATHSDDDEETVTLSLDYFLSLLSAKRELRQLKAALPGPPPTTDLPDAADYLSSEHPELIDYSGMTLSQAVEVYPDLIDYDLWERDC